MTLRLQKALQGSETDVRELLQRKTTISSSLLSGREGGVSNFPTGKSEIFFTKKNRETVALGARPAGGHGKNPPNGLAVRVIACKYRKVSDSTIIISTSTSVDCIKMFGLVMSGFVKYHFFIYENIYINSTSLVYTKLYASLWFCGLFDLAPKTLQNCKQWAPFKNLVTLLLVLVLSEQSEFQPGRSLVER